jgi:hypothetical protein
VVGRVPARRERVGPTGGLTAKCGLCGTPLRLLHLPSGDLKAVCTNPVCRELHDNRLRPTGRKLPHVVAPAGS